MVDSPPAVGWISEWSGGCGSTGCAGRRRTATPGRRYEPRLRQRRAHRCREFAYQVAEPSRVVAREGSAALFETGFRSRRNMRDRDEMHQRGEPGAGRVAGVRYAGGVTRANHADASRRSGQAGLSQAGRVPRVGWIGRVTKVGTARSGHVGRVHSGWVHVGRSCGSVTWVGHVGRSRGSVMRVGSRGSGHGGQVMGVRSWGSGHVGRVMGQVMRVGSCGSGHAGRVMRVGSLRSGYPRRVTRVESSRRVVPVDPAGTT